MGSLSADLTKLVSSIGKLENIDNSIAASTDTLADMISKDEIKANYDYKYYNNLLNQVLDSLDTTREKTTMSAIFLATVFPHLPYFWGGGHEKNCLGVDPEWGSEKQVTDAGSSTTGKYLPYSFPVIRFDIELIFVS